jgi:hypothetical protein
MHDFIQEVMGAYRRSRCQEIEFDFRKLEFIDPVGVVVLSNLLEYFKQLAVRVYFLGIRSSPGYRFLVDSGFFNRYVKSGGMLAFAVPRSTTMPLQLINGAESAFYLRNKLVPWIGATTGLTAGSLDSLRACLQKVFQNVQTIRECRRVARSHSTSLPVTSCKSRSPTLA